MNTSDSERVSSYLEKLGFKKTEDWEKIDLLIFNTCSVRQSAENRVMGQINLIQRNHPIKKDLKIIITGCMLYHGEEFLTKKLSRQVLLLSIKDLSKWDQELIKYFPEVKNEIKEEFFEIIPSHNSKFQAYVPISFGCNNFCSYCVVPYARDREKSRPMDEIYDEVKDLVDRGYKEITLLGQNVNSYRTKSEIRNQKFEFKESFPQLLELINNIKGDFWIRFFSSHPKDLSDELIQAIAKLPKVTNYLHLAVQSGDNQILKAMNRRYTAEHYKELIKKARKAVPGIIISTDVIVGFPGETKKQFENTVKLFEEVRFEMGYINRYSPREKTAAFKLKDDVSYEDKKSRDQKINKVLSKNIKKQNKKLIGKKIKVLVEKQKGDCLIGKDEGFKTVRFKGDKNLIGKFVTVIVLRDLNWGLEGMVDGRCEMAEVRSGKKLKNVKKKLVVILGATASGKTGLAKKLIKQFQAASGTAWCPEVISADSKQVYKGLDIGTAKDKSFPQFLIDIKKPGEDFSVSDYQKTAYQKMEEIWERGNFPFLVGGTGLYINAITDGYVLPGDKPDLKLRKELESKSLIELQKQLEKLDKTVCGKIDMQNKRRVVRALEVVIKTGKSITEKQTTRKPDFDILMIGIEVDREKLYQRINKRVLEMIDQGLVDEVKKFYSQGCDFKHGSFSGIGYRQILEDVRCQMGDGRWETLEKVMKNYKISQETIEKIQQDTRNYAKRQMTWFKRNGKINWVKSVEEAGELVREFTE